MTGILGQNPLLGVFHGGTYTMAAITAIILLLVTVVSLWRHNIRQALLFAVFTVCYAAAAVDLGGGYSLIGGPALMVVLALLLLAAACITAWNSTARTDMKLLQTMVPVTLASLTATFAVSLTADLYAIDSPERLSWLQVDGYMWAGNFVVIIIFVTTALVCATYDLMTDTTDTTDSVSNDAYDDVASGNYPASFTDLLQYGEDVVPPADRGRRFNFSMPRLPSLGRRRTASDDPADSDADQDSDVKSDLSRGNRTDVDDTDRTQILPVVSA